MPETQPATRVIADVFESVSVGQVQSNLAEMLHTPEQELDSRLEGVTSEVLFHIVTNPELRRRLAPMDLPLPADAAPGDFPSPAAVPAEAQALEPAPDLQAAADLSPRLQSRLGS